MGASFTELLGKLKVLIPFSMVWRLTGKRLSQYNSAGKKEEG